MTIKPVMTERERIARVLNPSAFKYFDSDFVDGQTETTYHKFRLGDLNDAYRMTDHLLSLYEVKEKDNSAPATRRGK